MNTSLNPEQEIAASHRDGPLLVLAGAGSGKTRIVTMRIAHLIETGVPSSEILAVTFTNKAAQEMKERVEKMCTRHVTICTFHSLGVRILRESIQNLGYLPGFNIYDEEDANKVLRMALERLAYDSSAAEVKNTRAAISDAKNRMEGPQNCDPAIRDVYTIYQNLLKEFNAVDFDDLLFLTVELFQNHPAVLESYRARWKYLLIDEYQDTNACQYTIAKLLVEKTRNIFVVGDPDQSIYSWRGANIENILNFERDYPGAKIVRLEQNYRSTSNILEAANAVIARNTARFEKNLWSNLGEGELIGVRQMRSERDEANFVIETLLEHHLHDRIPYSEIVVFYRTNAQSRALEDVFLRNRIPYTIVGGMSFYQRKEIKDILSFLRLAHSASDFVSFTRTVNLPARGLGPGAIEKIVALSKRENIPVLQACSLLASGADCEDIKLSKKQKESLGQYVNLILQLNHLSTQNSVEKLIDAAIRETGYMDFLRADKDTFQDRRENLQALLAKGREWDLENEGNLEAFLEELSLRSTLDNVIEGEEKVSLMTIHNGKGLEFELAFIVGLEEELFPHINSRDTPEQLEEERRLFYVGITRARKLLYLTAASLRYLWGQEKNMRPSRFFSEIPRKYLKILR